MKNVKKSKAFIWQLPKIDPDKLVSFNNWFTSEFGFSYHKGAVCWYLHSALVHSALGRSENASQSYIRELVETTESANFLTQIISALKINRPSFSKGKYARSIKVDVNRAKELLQIWSSYQENKQPILSISELDNIEAATSRLESESMTSLEQVQYLNEHSKYLGLKYPVSMNWNAEDAGNLQLVKQAILAHNGPISWYADNHRVYAAGVSLCNIPTRYRRAITPRSAGFLEIDLKSAHLAIFAGLFKNKYIQEKLSLGVDIYEDNSRYGTRSEIKNICNVMLYGAGIPMQQIQFCLDEDTKKDFLDLYAQAKLLKKPQLYGVANKLIDNPTKCRLEHFVHSELYENLEKIQSQQETITHDIFNNEIPHDVNSKPSYFAFSCEKLLTWPIYQLALEKKEYRIILDQHDGVTIHTDKDQDKIFAEIKDAVESNARKHGIITTLEIKNV